MKTKELIYCSLFICLIAIGARIQIPIPYVPFTLQLLFTIMAGLLLGGKLGFFAVGSYVVCGLLGLPVFTDGGGFGYIFKPTFGYLIGYALGAYVTGSIANKVPNPSYKRLLSANLCGLAVLYAIGMVYCYFVSNFYLGTPLALYPLFLYCFIIPIPGDIALCMFAAFLGKKLIPIIKFDRR